MYGFMNEIGGYYPNGRGWADSSHQKVAGRWIMIRYDQSFNLQKFSFTTCNAINNSLQIFAIQGSNDGINFNTLQEYDVRWSSWNETKTFDLPVSESFHYFRWITLDQSATNVNTPGMRNCIMYGA
jgi:hypothetical protein